MSICSMIRKLFLKRVNKMIISTAKNVGVRFINNSFSSKVNRNTIIGDDVSFNGLRIVGDGGVKIGSHFHCAEGCFIITENHDYDNGRELPYDHERSIVRDIVIEENVWLGTNVIVLPGAHIKEGAIIQAGSVVMGEIDKCGIAGGHPAKVFKYRNFEHYEKLKRENAYIQNV